ncbi:MAG: glycosyltransferase family 2 protein [Aquincola sp.]|nr:glycosyltransferase family 2 protein [Aquincola sp.]
MTARRTPEVSLGMPAYNSAGTIRSAIECLLGQDFQDLELIISDNASTDDTWSIVQEYASRDRRVVAVRQPRNLGANGNYCAVFRAAQGRYFKWASSNDWCAPRFISLCAAHLARNPDAVLVAPRTKLFAEDVADGTDYAHDLAFEHSDAVERFKDVLQRLRLNNVMNGLIRTAALRRTRLIEHYPGSDVVLVAHLALLGKILLLDEHLFGRRMDKQTATSLMTPEQVQRHHYPQRTSRSLFPTWRNSFGGARAVLSVDLRISDRLRGLAWVARQFHWRSTDLRQDVVDAIRYLR